MAARKIFSGINSQHYININYIQEQEQIYYHGSKTSSATESLSLTIHWPDNIGNGIPPKTNQMQHKQVAEIMIDLTPPINLTCHIIGITDLLKEMCTVQQHTMMKSIASCHI